MSLYSNCDVNNTKTQDNTLSVFKNDCPVQLRSCSHLWHLSEIPKYILVLISLIHSESILWEYNDCMGFMIKNYHIFCYLKIICHISFILVKLIINICIYVHTCICYSREPITKNLPAYHWLEHLKHKVFKSHTCSHFSKAQRCIQNGRVMP